MIASKKGFANEEGPKYIPLGEIVIDAAFRVRECENQDEINDLADVFKLSMKECDDGNYPFPPVYVLRRGNQYVLIAGFHRFFTAQQAKIKTILASEFVGSEDEAFRLALQDNHKNGQRLSNDDLKVCIEKAFRRYPNMSFSIISDMTGASKTRCFEVKKAMEQLPEYQDLFSEKVTGKDGRVQSATKKVKQKPKTTPESQEPDVAPTQEQPEVLATQEEPKGVPTQEQPKELSIQQEPPTVSTALPADDGDDDDIIRRDRLIGLPIRLQISRYCHALECFERELEGKDKEYLYGKVRRWLDPLSPPSKQNRSTIS